jgi:hypothetical protein
MNPLEEKPSRGEALYVGILGKTESITQDKLCHEVLNPLLSLWKRLPDKMLMSSEGLSSVLTSIWAERNEIEYQMIDANYCKLGRRAGFLRDAMILKESTHLLIFLGTRSQKNEEVAIREAKKGKKVYTVNPKSLEITELCYEDT